MATETMAPAPPASGLDKFLSATLPNTPAPVASAAPATTPDLTKETPAEKPTTAPLAPAPPAAPSGSEPPTDVPVVPTIEALQKTLNDQTRANKKLGRNNVDLLKQMETLKFELKEMREKYDGTYTAPVGPTPEQERALIEYNARESASRKVAEEKYGPDLVKQKIFDEDSPYRALIGEHPWVHQRVLTSDTPILEAFTALEEFEVLNTYGRTPQAVLTNVTKTVKDHLWKEWTQQMTTAAPQTQGKAVPTLGDIRGDTTRADTGRPVNAFDVTSFNRHIP